MADDIVEALVSFIFGKRKYWLGLQYCSNCRKWITTNNERANCPICGNQLRANPRRGRNTA